MADERSLATESRAQDAPSPQPDFGAPRGRSGMARLQRNQLAQGPGPQGQSAESLEVLHRRLGAERPTAEIAELALPLLRDPATRQQVVHALNRAGRAADVLVLVDDPVVGEAIRKMLGGNLSTDVFSGQNRRVHALQARTAFVLKQYRGLEEVVQEFYPGHWEALIAVQDFSFEALGATMWDQMRVVTGRDAFLTRALTMLPGIRERGRMEEEAAVHRQVRLRLEPILAQHYADGTPANWMRVWSDLMEADRQYVGSDAARDYVRREVSQRNHEVVQAQDQLAVGGLLKAEAAGGVTGSDMLAAYRSLRHSMEAAWKGSATDALPALATSSAGQNYDRLAAPLRGQTQTLLETYGVLAEAIRGDKTATQRAKAAFGVGVPTSDNGDVGLISKPRGAQGPWPEAPTLAEASGESEIAPSTMGEVGRADAMLSADSGSPVRLEHDPLFVALSLTQEGGDSAARGAIAIADMAQAASLHAVGHQFYRAAFGVPDELPGNLEERRAALDTYKPKGGEFAAAWDRWVGSHDIYEEWFNLKDSTWDVIVELSLHIVLGLIVGLASGGVGAALELSAATVFVMEVLVFTASSEVLSAHLHDRPILEGGPDGFMRDLGMNAATMGVMRVMGPAYKALTGVDPARLSLASTSIRQMALHQGGALMLENLAMDGVAIGLAAAEAAASDDVEFTADDAFDIVLMNAAMSLGFKLGQAGINVTRALLPGRRPPEIDALDARIQANHESISSGGGRRETAMNLAARQQSLLAQKDGLLAAHLGTGSAEYQKWRGLYDFLLVEAQRFELIKATRLHQVGATEFQYRATPEGANAVRQRLTNAGIAHTRQPTPEGPMFSFLDPISRAEYRILPRGKGQQPGQVEGQPAAGPTAQPPRPEARQIPETVFTSEGVAIHLPPGEGLKHALESHTVENFNPRERLNVSNKDATLFRPGSITNAAELRTLVRQALEGRAGLGIRDGMKNDPIDLVIRNISLRVIVGARSGGGTQLVTVFPTRGLVVTKETMARWASQIEEGKLTLQEVRDKLRRGIVD